MTAKKVSIGACIFIALLIALLTQQHLQTTKLEGQVADTKLQQQIDAIVNDLRVPSEALYYDTQTSRQIRKIRLQFYKNMEIKKFLPYQNVSGQSEGNVFEVNILAKAHNK